MITGFTGAAFIRGRDSAVILPIIKGASIKIAPVSKDGEQFHWNFLHVSCSHVSE